MTDLEMPILAFDFGGTRGRCCLGGLDGSHAHIVGFDRGHADDGALWLKRLISAGREITQHTKNLRIVSVSFGGPVTPDGRVTSMHVPGWENVDLVREMTRAFDVPVVVENDANSGAVGEHRFGAGKGARYMAFFTVSTGIGGGVILDNKLYRGAHGMAAEFGHMVLETGPNAPKYAAGKSGILEALASGPAIGREGSIARGKHSTTTRVQLFTEMEAKLGMITAKDVFDAVEKKEAWALKVRDEVVMNLGRGVAAVICAFDVERVVIGGGVALAGKVLFEPLRKAVDFYLPTFLLGKADIVQSTLGDRAALLGAVASAAERLTTDNTLAFGKETVVFED